MKTILFFFQILFFTTYNFLHAQESNLIMEVDDQVSVSSESVSIDVDAKNIEILTSDENNNPTSYLIKGEKGRVDYVVGISSDPSKPQLGIFNAYIGYQTILGIRAGVELFNRVEIGFHAATNLAPAWLFGLTNKKTIGLHANVHFYTLNFKNDSKIDLIAGFKFGQHYKKTSGFGSTYYTTKGNTASAVLGFRFKCFGSKDCDERTTFRIEAGYTFAPNGLNAPNGLDSSNSDPISNIKYQAPILNFSVTYRIFK